MHTRAYGNSACCKRGVEYKKYISYKKYYPYISRIEEIGLAPVIKGFKKYGSGCK